VLFGRIAEPRGHTGISLHRRRPASDANSRTPTNHSGQYRLSFSSSVDIGKTLKNPEDAVCAFSLSPWYFHACAENTAKAFSQTLSKYLLLMPPPWPSLFKAKTALRRNIYVNSPILMPGLFSSMWGRPTTPTPAAYISRGRRIREDSSPGLLISLSGKHRPADPLSLTGRGHPRSPKETDLVSVPKKKR